MALLMVLGTGCGDGGSKTPVTPGEEEPGNGGGAESIAFADSSLEAAVRAAVEKPEGELAEADLQEVTQLEAQGLGIVELEGIENLENLAVLNLSDNRIEDISPLAALSQLAFLDLGFNQIGDITPLASLPSLEVIGLPANQVTDLSPLMGLVHLRSVLLTGNPLDSESAISQLEELRARGVQVDYAGYRDTAGEETQWSGRIACSRDRDIWALFPDGRQVQLTEDPGNDIQPAWSPDGTRLAFASDRTGSWDIYRIDADGTGLRNLTADAYYDQAPCWSPGGARIPVTSGESIRNEEPAWTR